MNHEDQLTAVSLFCSAGIGDLALRAAGADVIVANELLPDRSALFEKNYPECELLTGDIRLSKSSIVEAAIERLKGRQLDILFATPPCQGMSKNGRGKLLNMVRAGLRPEFDERNQLILDVIDIANVLRPRLIILENVPEMKDTYISVDGRPQKVLQTLHDLLSPDYEGSESVVEFADYGVPQRRKRLITAFSLSPDLATLLRSGSQAWLPPTTHAQRPTLLEKRWLSVSEAIGDIEPLDAGNINTAKGITHEFHRVPVLDEAKYFWVANTPPGGGAFDNQCVNPDCFFDRNATHGSIHKDGINQSKKTTPIYCEQCGEVLPRPWVIRNGRHEIMSGFTSAYKRMRNDLPASALTRNLSYACSDQKLHPTQNRVLSLYEALILHTVSEFPFIWERSDGKKVSDKLVREVIGESIPPTGLKAIFDHLLQPLRKHKSSVVSREEAQVSRVI